MLYHHPRQTNAQLSNIQAVMGAISDLICSVYKALLNTPSTEKALLINIRETGNYTQVYGILEHQTVI